MSNSSLTIGGGAGGGGMFGQQRYGPAAYGAKPGRSIPKLDELEKELEEQPTDAGAGGEAGAAPMDDAAAEPAQRSMDELVDAEEHYAEKGAEASPDGAPIGGAETEGGGGDAAGEL